MPPVPRTGSSGEPASAPTNAASSTTSASHTKPAASADAAARFEDVGTSSQPGGGPKAIVRSTKRSVDGMQAALPVHGAKDDLASGARASLDALTMRAEEPAPRALERSLPPGTPSDPASVAKRAAIARGTRMEGLEALLGFPVGLQGLAGVYAEALPGMHVSVAPSGRDDRTFRIEISSGNGLVASSSRTLSRREDGSLSLHQMSTFTQPAFRGRGISARLVKAELEMLRSFSSDENTCLSLGAGGMFNPEVKGGRVEGVGKYAWATLGYDFRNPESERENMPRRFQWFLDSITRADENDFEDPSARTALREAARSLKDEGFRTTLEEASRNWSHSWEIAQFDIPGLRLPFKMGDREGTCHVGKAFLFSDEIFSWSGVRYANRPEAPETAVADALLERSIARSNEGWRTT
jgi:hypothetical protein